ncbi:MAG: phosphotransferase family protein [Acidimicrobiales bacterium]
MSAASGRRDLDATRLALESWLGARLATVDVTVCDLSVPKAGFSNETILGRASWVDDAGKAAERSFVLRIEPSDHQLFVRPDAIRQARVMEGLAGAVPVPKVWLTESDRSFLGAPFFLMDRVVGRIPSDVPSWHRRGWTTELDPARRARLCDNGLIALAELHRVDWHESLRFLEPHGSGTALDGYVTHVEEWYQWCGPVRLYGADVIDAAMKYVRDEMPDDDRARVVWGDARVGNIIYGDDLSVAAMLDWESASIGPPEIDVAWWVMFDEYLCEAQGLARLDGAPGRGATLARYEELSGRALANIEYYEVLAGLVFALINSRLADSFIRSGVLRPGEAAELVTRVTDMTARRLSTAPSTPPGRS